MGHSQNFGEGFGFGTSPVPPVKPQQPHYGQSVPECTPNIPHRQYVKYVPVGFATSHNKTVGYLLWVVGFTGAHRFYYGKPLTGALWFFTAGLLGIGWLIDLFLIPSMNREANDRYRPGSVDYGVAWLFLALLGWFGIHRFYQGKIVTGILYLLTGGLFGIGLIYDICTLNEQVNELHYRDARTWDYQSSMAF